MGISRHPVLLWLSTFFAVVFLGFGLAYTLYPHEAFPTLGFPSPSTSFDLQLMDAMIQLYGAKDLFMGTATLAATWLGNRKTAGLTLTAAAMCAGVDGYVVNRFTGTGEWGHWGYGSVAGLVGLALVGVFG